MKVEITGMSEVLDILEKAGPKHSRNLMRATTHAVAGRITKQARKNAPKDEGTLRKGIKTKRKKSPPEKPVSQVTADKEAFHWRFHEYGTSTGVSEKRFIREAAEYVRADFKNIYTEEFGKKLEAALKREAKRNAKK